ncbi:MULTISPECIES: TonB-dependent receptor [Brucella]|uniref:Heme transporter BhuA n=1 Tax=Ochrobactrum soli TaxID=2448455 RepID=A0A2P9HBX1_9HYPH|nr:MULTISPECIES: TonB-dependent receptor [Brucella]MDX4072166.1 TonB-dependent siderophore receptor [Brucella sp. NBRC 113783]SPL61593.1 TonB-dependent siderophore receptor [[Ochrobactrum] soli]
MGDGNSARIRRSAGIVTFLLAGTAMMSVPAVEQAKAQSATTSATSTKFNIPAQSLSTALIAFSRQTKLGIFVTSSLASGKKSTAVNGALSPEVALQRLLSGTGLTYTFTNQNTVRIIGSDHAATATSPDGSVILETITVQGQGVTTEGTGAYTIPEMSSATGLPLSIKETPQSVSVVTNQKIKDKAYTSLDQAINDVPGLIATPDFGDSRWQYYARGSLVNSIQYDGLTNSVTTFSRDGTTQDDLILYDRIEVVRGATGLLQGTGNPSASINLVRKKPTDVAQTSVTTTGSSWGNGRIEVDASRPLNEEGTVRGRFAGSFLGGEGYRDYNDQRNFVLYGVIEADLTENTTASLGISHQKEHVDGYGNGGYPTRPDGSFYDWTAKDYLGSDWEYSDKRKTTAYFDLEHRFGNDWKANVTAQYSWSSGTIESSYLTYSNGTYLKNDRIYDGDSKSYAIDGRFSGPVELFGRTHDLIFGASTHRDDFSYSAFSAPAYAVDIFNWDPSAISKPSMTTNYYNTDPTITETGLYGAGRFTISDDLKFILGARVSWYDYNSPVEKVSLSEDAKFVPYVGAVYDLTDTVSVYASYTSIFQPQPYYDPSGSILAPIEGRNVEAGVKGSFFDDRFNASVAIFQSNQNNLPIYYGTACAGSPSCYTAADEVRTRGVEFELNGKITNQLNVSASYTFAKAEYVEGTKEGQIYNSAVSPENMFKLYASYDFDQKLEGLTVGGGVRAFSKTYYTATTSYKEQPAYAVVDLMAKYDFNDSTAMQLNVNNVFDKTYYSKLSTSTAYGNFIGAPRNVTLSLTHKF